MEQDHSQDSYLFFTTRLGVVKRTSVADFANIRQNGLKALNLKDEDELINVFQLMELLMLLSEQNLVILFASMRQLFVT